MAKRKLQWGEFPQLTAEEAQVEIKLDPAEIAMGASWFETKAMADAMNSIRRGLDNADTKIHAESKLFGLINAAIESTSKIEKTRVVSGMSKEMIFKRMRPELGLALAIKSIRANDTILLSGIVANIKKEQSFHPDLSTFKTTDGKSLGHYAARCNQMEALKALVAINPLCLATPNNDRENVAHTASRFGAWRCLDYLVEKQPELFAKENKSGQTPLDLEGAKLIRSKMTLEKAQAAEQAAKEKQSLGREVLQAASKKAPKPPLVAVNSKPEKAAKSLETDGFSDR
jgi:hypothetical protein